MENWSIQDLRQKGVNYLQAEIIVLVGKREDCVHVFHKVAFLYVQRHVENRLLGGEVAEGIEESALRGGVKASCDIGGP